jgi:hypothetical protein
MLTTRWLGSFVGGFFFWSHADAASDTRRCHGTIRHRLIGVRNNRYDCHSRRECVSQDEGQGYLFHCRLPFITR